MTTVKFKPQTKLITTSAKSRVENLAFRFVFNVFVSLSGFTRVLLESLSVGCVKRFNPHSSRKKHENTTARTVLVDEQ